ncbi:hypothetical protein ES703_93779 [subsurface metagenome]
MIKVTYGPKINYRLCNGCRRCYDNCPLDVFGWDNEEGLPTVAYPDECCYCGICELECLELAINVEVPLHSRLYLGLYPEKVSQ